MTRTRADIVAEVTAMRLSPRLTATMIALAEFQSGLPVDQVCPDCGRPVQVAGRPEGAERPWAWVMRCGCGESSGRGLERRSRRIRGCSRRRGMIRFWGIKLAGAPPLLSLLFGEGGASDARSRDPLRGRRVPYHRTHRPVAPRGVRLLGRQLDHRLRRGPGRRVPPFGRRPPPGRGVGRLPRATRPSAGVVAACRRVRDDGGVAVHPGGGDGRGHMACRCVVRDEPGIGNTLDCTLATDQTFTRTAVAELAAVVRAFPAIGRP